MESADPEDAPSQPTVGPSFHHSSRHQPQKSRGPRTIRDHRHRSQSMREKVSPSPPEYIPPPRKSSHQENREEIGRGKERKHRIEGKGSQLWSSQDKQSTRANEKRNSEEEQHRKPSYRKHTDRERAGFQHESSYQRQTAREEAVDREHMRRSLLEKSGREKQRQHTDERKNDQQHGSSDEKHSEENRGSWNHGGNSQRKYSLQEHSGKVKERRHSEREKNDRQRRSSDQTHSRGEEGREEAARARGDHHHNISSQEHSGRGEARERDEEGRHTGKEKEQWHSRKEEVDQRQRSSHRKNSENEKKHSMEGKHEHIQYEENNNIVLAPWSKATSGRSSSSGSESKRMMSSTSRHQSTDEVAEEAESGNDDGDHEDVMPLASADRATSLAEIGDNPDTLVDRGAKMSPSEVTGSSSGGASTVSSVLASRKMASMDNEGDLPEHLQNFPSPPLLSPPPPDYDVEGGAFTYTNGKPYHHKLNISSHPEGERILIPEENEDDGLIKPKPLVNPCIQSRERMDLHRELKHSGRKVLDKPELSKVFRDRKITEKKKEAEKYNESNRTSMEIKLMERQEMLEKEEKAARLAKEGIVENDEETSKPEFAKVKLRQTNASKT